ncbi:aminotransferase class V-fold PLP-dependent enzyme [Reyranella sp. CPCC 100927]|uniref:aminotransferase class V-fold PLP-dependent enzyme n=1 Tax=Reyranella sp. CPCC 100927 TaxID=2599616 RepID=UPI0015B3EAB7|nr:aminotransferase class V-fold PLP-dependent enzyme [Reyranella sp. CPCC 100927]
MDVARLRAETPGCAKVVHLNNAGSALPTQRTLAATLDHLRLEAEIGGYEAADREHDRIEAFYPSVAKLIGAQPDEIAFIENATRAWDMAFYSLAFAPGDCILTCRSEYSSNYISYLQVAHKTGAEIVTIPDDAHGQIDVKALAERVDRRTKLISINHVPTQGGLVNPAAEVGKVARAAGVPYLLDACQTVGQIPIDVAAIGCDFLSATGRKYLRGPRGTGFLYARRETTAHLEPIFLDNHAARWTGATTYEVRPDARRFENWERYYGGVLGLAAAVDQANALGVDAIWTRIQALSAALRQRLARLPGVTLTDLGAVKCGIVTFTVDGANHDAIRTALRARDINVSISTKFSSRLDMDGRGLETVIRASVHIYNTEDELDRFVAALQAVRNA